MNIKLFPRLMMILLFMIPALVLGQKGYIFSPGQKLTYHDGSDLNPGYFGSNNLVAVPCVVPLITILTPGSVLPSEASLTTPDTSIRVCCCAIPSPGYTSKTASKTTDGSQKH